jgi:hypothetical protein
MPNKTFLDSAGLSTFLTNLKTAYAGNNTEAFSTFTVGQAGKLATARTVTFATGDVTGSFSFDGSANVSDVALTVTGLSGKLTGVATSNSDTVTVSDGVATINMGAYALKTDITAVMKFKGTKTSDELGALTGMETGDVYSIVSGGTGSTYKVGSEYAYDGSSWVELGPVIDLSGYVVTSRTVNSKALSGDIVLDGSDIDLSTNYAVAGTAAAPAAGDSIDTAVGKLQAEIATKADTSSLHAVATSGAYSDLTGTPTLATVATSGDYTDLSNTPTDLGDFTNNAGYIKLSDVPEDAVADVQTNASGSYASVLDANKVAKIDLSGYAKSADLASVATSGSYNDLSNTPTIPTVATAIADSDTGYATGDQVYDYIEALPISTATINNLFGISNS